MTDKGMNVSKNWLIAILVTIIGTLGGWFYSERSEARTALKEQVELNDKRIDQIEIYIERSQMMDSALAVGQSEIKKTLNDVVLKELRRLSR